MGKFNKQYVACFLLLCIALTIVSFAPFHSHTEDSNICHDDAEVENNACHISIYHKESQENKCEHEQHFSDVQEECEFCKYITTRRYQFILNESSYISVVTIYRVSENVETFLIPIRLNSNFLGRAPPVF